MKVQRGHSIEKWWIAKDGNTKVHYGKVEVGLEVRTGLPELMTYDTESEWVAALGLLNIYPDELTEI